MSLESCRSTSANRYSDQVHLSRHEFCLDETKEDNDNIMIHSRAANNDNVMIGKQGNSRAYTLDRIDRVANRCR